MMFEKLFAIYNSSYYPLDVSYTFLFQAWHNWSKHHWSNLVILEENEIWRWIHFFQWYVQSLLWTTLSFHIPDARHYMFIPSPFLSVTNLLPKEEWKSECSPLGFWAIRRNFCNFFVLVTQHSTISLSRVILAGERTKNLLDWDWLVQIAPRFVECWMMVDCQRSKWRGVYFALICP